jgi:hypothetical protein
MRSKKGSGCTALEITIPIAVLVLLVSPFSSGALGQTLRQIGVVDLGSMTVRKRLVTEAKLNGSVYAAPLHKVYVSNTPGRAVTVVDTDKGEAVQTIRFDSEMRMPQYDSAAHKVYVNLRNANEIAEIDPATDTVLGDIQWMAAHSTTEWPRIRTITVHSFSTAETEPSRPSRWILKIDCASPAAGGRRVEIRPELGANLCSRLFERIHSVFQAEGGNAIGNLRNSLWKNGVAVRRQGSNLAMIQLFKIGP